MIKRPFFILLFVAGNTMITNANTDSSISLTLKDRSVVAISAYAALGDMASLKTALNIGLDAGLSISETKEMLVQLYAYAGFPRSLNALNNLMTVLEERRKKGINDPDGMQPSPNPKGKSTLKVGTENQRQLTGRTFTGGVFAFAPAIDQFLKEHLFGAIFSRNNLDWKTREIVTISALAAMPGVESQLYTHYNVGMYNGLTSTQLFEIVSIIEGEVNSNRGMVAGQVLQSVINQKPYTPQILSDQTIFPTGQKITNDNFVGTAWLQPLIQSDSINKIQVGNVTFEPGARTKWHYHPAGQILLALDGLGYYQEKGNTKILLRKGDVIQCPPNVPHWHGASPREKFVQVAITNSEKGSTVWLQPVSEEEYNN